MGILDLVFSLAMLDYCSGEVLRALLFELPQTVLAPKYLTTRQWVYDRAMEIVRAPELE